MGEDIENTEPLEGIVKHEVPFAGTYYSKITTVKRQSTLPRKLRQILELRQERGIRDCALFYSIGPESIILKDDPSEDECPNFELIRVGVNNRILLPDVFQSYAHAKYVGKKYFIEVFPSMGHESEPTHEG